MYIDFDFDAFFKPPINNNFIWVNSNFNEEYNISYKNIYNYIIYFSNYLENFGINKGDYVLLLFETSPHFLIPFLSCLVKNYIPICAYPNNTIQIQKIIDECKPKVILVSKNYNELLKSNITYDNSINDVEYINEQFDYFYNELNKKKEFLKLTDEQLLQIYSLYKQSTIGDINIESPSILNFKAYSKWNSWNKLKGTIQIETKKRYNKIVSELLNNNTTNNIYKSMDLIESSIETIIDGYKTTDISNKNIYNNIKNIDENSTAFIQYSSGSTNNPKGVVITYKNITENIRSIINFMTKDMENYSINMLCWLPQYHDMGLVGNYLTSYILSTINAHTSSNAYFMSPMTFISNYKDVLKFSSKNKIDFVCFPNFAFEIFNSNFIKEDYEECGLNLHSLNILTGSEKIRIDSINKFVNNFSKYGFSEKNIYPAYGLAEFTLMVTINKGLTINDSDISVGKINSGSATSIIIVDPKTNKLCNNGKSGEIWINGVCTAKEYFNNKELTNNLLRAKLEENSKIEYLKTGDLGYIIDEHLYVNGRIKELIIINGKNYYPEDIENTLNKITVIRKGNNCAISIEENNTESLVLITELYTDTSKLSFSSIKKEILKNHGIEPKYIFIVPYDTLPKTSSGKIKRVLLKELYKTNKLNYIEKLDKYSGDSDNIVVSNLDNRIVSDFSFIFLEYSYNDDTKNFKLSELGITSINIAIIYQKINTLIDKYDHNNINKIKFNISHCFSLTYEELYELLLNLYNNEPFYIGGKNNENILSNTLKLMHQDIIISTNELPQFNEYGKSLNDDNCNIFITGVTGFLGSFLLYELLTRTKCFIYAHVRCNDETHGYTRINEILNKYKLLNYNISNLINKRVTIIQGDLEMYKLGLSEEKYDYLCKIIDVIFHSGAGVNYIQPYENLRGSHVIATKEIVKMCFNKKQKELHHMSSSTTCGFFDAEKHPVLYETDINYTGDNINFGYGQGKWAAEMIVYNAIKLGLKCKIYRPSFLTSDSKKATYHEQDIIVKIFELMLDHKKTFYGDFYLNCIPVDIAASNIISLSLMKDFYSKIFHITTDLKKNIDNTEYQYKLIEHFFKIPLEFMTLNDFVDHINTKIQPSESFYPLLPFFNDHYKNIAKTAGKIYDNSFCKSCFNKYPEFKYKSCSNKDTIIYICRYLMNKPKFNLFNILINYIHLNKINIISINVIVLCIFLFKIYNV